MSLIEIYTHKINKTINTALKITLSISRAKFEELFENLINTKMLSVIINCI